MPGDWTPISPPLPPPLHAAPDLRFLLPSAVELVVPIECATPATGWCEHRRFRKYRVPYAVARRDPMPSFVPAGSNVNLASTYVAGCTGANVTTPYPVREATGDGQDGIDGLAVAAAESYYGWRVAGSDDRYDGIVAYPIDAHDDTLVFTYRDGEASVRVAPVPHGRASEQTLLHASGTNCELGVVSFVRRSATPGVKAVGVTRPLYADGTLGPACFAREVDQMSSCGSCDPGCCSSGA